MKDRIESISFRTQKQSREERRARREAGLRQTRPARVARLLALAHDLSDTFIAGLWAIDYMFEVAKRGGTGINFHNGETGMDGTVPFYYEAIKETSGVVVQVQPEYYGMLLFTQAGTGAMVPRPSPPAPRISPRGPSGRTDLPAWCSTTGTPQAASTPRWISEPR